MHRCVCHIILLHLISSNTIASLPCGSSCGISSIPNWGSGGSWCGQKGFPSNGGHRQHSWGRGQGWGRGGGRGWGRGLCGRTCAPQRCPVGGATRSFCRGSKVGGWVGGWAAGGPRSMIDRLIDDRSMSWIDATSAIHPVHLFPVCLLACLAAWLPVCYIASLMPGTHSAISPSLSYKLIRFNKLARREVWCTIRCQCPSRQKDPMLRLL